MVTVFVSLGHGKLKGLNEGKVRVSIGERIRLVIQVFRPG